MSTPSLVATRVVRLADRVAAARRKRFIGRSAEIALFRDAMLAPHPPFVVLQVHGPGGVGKTALLSEYARVAADMGVLAAMIDGRNTEASPTGFLLALRLALGLTGPGSPFDTLAQHDRYVLLIDTYEVLAPLDAWLREEFLLQLPNQCLVVIAGRSRLTPHWIADPGWQDLVRSLSLRNLTPEESRLYLNARGVPDNRQQEVLAFTHGHPLALALVADVQVHGDERAALLSDHEPDVVRVLLERFVQHVPSPLHRHALEACAHVRVTTEPLLAAALAADDVADIFAWLRDLSVIEQGPQGLFPHDLVRDLLDADLRWRNPEAYRQMHGRVRKYIVQEFQRAQGLEQQRAFFDLLYLHRHNPFMKPFHDWAALGNAYAERATPADVPGILELVRRHEGEQSAQIARYWLRRQPGAFTVFRTTGRELIGMVATLSIRDVTAEDRAMDPAMREAWEFSQRHGPIRPGEESIYHRFAMGTETYQAVSSAMNMVAMSCALHWLTEPRLAWSFLAISDPEEWRPSFSYLNLQRSPEADFEVGGRSYGLYTHDWRVEPALVWLETMGERELATHLDAEMLTNAASPPVVVLSQPEFVDAVRQALRDYARVTALTANPLMRSRLVLGKEGGSSPATLQALIREAVESLRGTPRGNKLYRAVYRTYLEPAATQELAAESLDLPFSTYRYQLNAGLERIADYLWQRELSGTDG